MKISKNILLVEDDTEDQEFFIDALKGVKNAVLSHVANNGREALDKLENALRPTDFIFSDINMPVMNGIEFLTEIIKSPHTRHIPVVILSTDTTRKELFFGLGAVAFIEKATVVKTLSDKIEKIINPDFICRNYTT